MQLDYRILWFDDQEQSIKPFVERVQGMIARLGFEPKVDLRIITADVAEPLVNLPAQADVDLVMMDYKLGGQHDGADWPQELERHGLVDRATRQKRLVEMQAQALAAGRQAGRVLAIGSTGTNRATARLLAAIARSPQGAVVLPGLDRDLDAKAWALVSGALGAGDEPSFGHPQAAMARLLPVLGLDRAGVLPLGAAPALAASIRERFVAEALRPRRHDGGVAQLEEGHPGGRSRRRVGRDRAGRGSGRARGGPGVGRRIAGGAGNKGPHRGAGDARSRSCPSGPRRASALERGGRRHRRRAARCEAARCLRPPRRNGSGNRLGRRSRCVAGTPFDRARTGSFRRRTPCRQARGRGAAYRAARRPLVERAVRCRPRRRGRPARPSRSEEPARRGLACHGRAVGGLCRGFGAARRTASRLPYARHLGRSAPRRRDCHGRRRRHCRRGGRRARNAPRRAGTGDRHPSLRRGGLRPDVRPARRRGGAAQHRSSAPAPADPRPARGAPRGRRCRAARRPRRNGVAAGGSHGRLPQPPDAPRTGPDAT